MGRLKSNITIRDMNSVWCSQLSDVNVVISPVFQASQKIRKMYDSKCDDLRQLELKQSSTFQIDKTRAAVKDLHSRIRVAIHRIDSISKRIEELRDMELQPQLEELIEGYGSLIPLN